MNNELTDALAVVKSVAAKYEIPALSVDHFTATPTGLIITGDPSYEEWEIYGQGLQLVERAIHWNIGDWLKYGEKRYGDTYTQAVELTGFTRDTVRRDKWVAERVQCVRRRTHLSFDHHREVAPLKPCAQDYWLDRAETEDLTRNELRRAIKEEERGVEVVWASRLRAVIAQIEALLNDAPTVEDTNALMLAAATLDDRLHELKKEVGDE